MAADRARDETAIDRSDFRIYAQGVTHVWFRVLLLVGAAQIAVFFVLDALVVSGPLLVRFGIYRAVASGAFLIQYLVLSRTAPHRLNFLHAYIAAVVVTCVIVLMTVQIGGFGSSYYVGLHLVMIGVSLFVPWSWVHTLNVCALVVVMYTAGNYLWGGPFTARQITEPLMFLSMVGVLAILITAIRSRNLRREFRLRSQLLESNWQLEQSRNDLRKARDALWGEMEIAKRIQTSLLPSIGRFNGYEIAATMLPAKEVGGDYYDLIPTRSGELWVTIGDVSGHGVESGLIMMMTQTSISTTVHRHSASSPTHVLDDVNTVLKENIARLGTNRYVTLSALRLLHGQVVVAGLHQDIIVYDAAAGAIRRVPTSGTWLGIVDDVGTYLEEHSLRLAADDVLLLFTDGITEATNRDGELYGQERLEQALQRYSHLSLDETLHNIIEGVTSFQDQQDDDITLVLLRKGR